MKRLRSFETSSSYYSVTKRHMPEERNPHVFPPRIRGKDINKENWPEKMIRFLRAGKGILKFHENGEFLKISATSILRKRCAEVKNDWSYTSAHPTFLCGVDTNIYLYLYLYECKLKISPRPIHIWELKKLFEVFHHYHHHRHHSDRHETGQPVICPESLIPVVHNVLTFAETCPFAWCRNV